MGIQIYLAYVFAATVILVVPGPTILLVAGQAAAHGRKSVLPLVSGVVLGDLTAMTFSLFGLGTVLAASSAVFAVLKWIGAAYLIFIGIRMWRIDPVACPRQIKTPSARSFFKSSYVVTALNPKGIAFFGAFVPQFINPGQPVLAQLFLMGLTFLFLAMVNAMAYAFFAGSLRDIMGKTSVRRWFNRCGASVLIGAGIITAGMQRAS